MDHPNLLGARIVRGPDGRGSLRLESSSAPTLAQVLSRRGKLPARHAIRIVLDIAQAVHALSSQGLMARDLTPGSIRLDPSHGAMLADRGIPLDLVPRKPSEARQDLAFRSPEERDGHALDARSSVYSLGAVLYAALTGSPPRESRPGRRASGARVDLPRPLAAVVERAMAHDPEDRYADVLELTKSAALAGLRVERTPSKAARRRLSGRPATSPAAPRARPKQHPAPAAAPRREQLRPLPEPTPTPAAAPTAEATPSRPRMKRPQITLPRIDLPRVKLTRPDLPKLPRVRRPDLSGVRPPSVALLRRPSVLAALGAVLVCAVAGVLLGRSTGEEAQASQLESRALTVRLPDGWAPAAVVRDPGAELSAAVAAAPIGDEGASLIVGHVPDSYVLDRRFRGEIAPENARTEVRLGPLEAWRYEGLVLRPGLVATAYLAPTTGGPLLILCNAPSREARTHLPVCERMATTILLRGERPLPLSEIDSRGAQVAFAITEPQT